MDHGGVGGDLTASGEPAHKGFLQIETQNLLRLLLQEWLGDFTLISKIKTIGATFKDDVTHQGRGRMAFDGMLVRQKSQICVTSSIDVA
jgi:hypothetical protein